MTMLMTNLKKKSKKKANNNSADDLLISYDASSTDSNQNQDPKLEVVNPTDFFKACAVGNFARVKDLLQKCSQLPSMLNEKKQTGLLLACKHGHYEIVRALIKAKSDLDISDYKNQTAVHYCIVNGHHKILNVLIKYNANVNSFDATGTYTPLMLAIRQRDYFAIHHLLDIVDLKLKNSNRQDIFDYVIGEKNISANTKFIFSSHARTREQYAKRTQIYNILLSQSKDIARMTTQEMMAFLANNKLEKQDVYHFVFHKRHEQMLCNIITKTSFVNDLKIVPTGYDHEYPFLLLSVKENLLPVVRALLEKGVDVNYPLQPFNENKILRLFSKEEVGKTPLMLAYKEGHEEMIELLLEYNADVESKDLNNWTVMDMAKENGDKVMLRKFKLYAS